MNIQYKHCAIHREKTDEYPSMTAVLDRRYDYLMSQLVVTSLLGKHMHVLTYVLVCSIVYSVYVYVYRLDVDSLLAILSPDVFTLSNQIFK